MMQEDVLVSKDDIRNEDHIEVTRPSVITSEISSISLTGRPFNALATSYKYTSFEVFVAAVVMLSTISGGFLEGYTSPAIPSLMTDSLAQNIFLLDKIESVNIVNISSTTVTYDLKSLIPISHQVEYVTESLVPLISEHSAHSNSTSNDSAVFPLSNITYLQNTSLYHNASSEKSEVLFEDKLTAIAPETLPQPLPLLSMKNESNSSSLPTSSDFDLSKEEVSWLGSLLLLGACLGAGLSPWIINLGRRHTILFSAFPRILGWLFIAAASSVSTIYAGRFLCGISLGVASAAAPIYISEVAHPSSRGSLSCVVQLGVSTGIFLAALFGTFMGWRVLAVVGALLVLGYFFPSFFIPNSPSWLIFQGRENEAREVLKKLRSHDYCVEEELQQIITVVEKHSLGSTVSWSGLLRERRTVMPLLIVILVTLVNRFSGYNAIITYCSTFLNQAVPSVSQYFAAVAVGFVQILATLLSVILVDGWGRRKLLILSVCMMGGSLIFIAVCEQITSSSVGGTWLAVLGTMSYVGAYSFGIGPLTWVLVGELFPLDARDKASAIVAVINWFAAFLVTKTYFSLESSAGVSGTCFVYASVCFLGLLIIYFLVPETKGRTLTEIEVHFSYTQNSWRPPLPNVDRALSSILDQEIATIDTYSTFH